MVIKPYAGKKPHTHKPQKRSTSKKTTTTNGYYFKMRNKSDIDKVTPEQQKNVSMIELDKLEKMLKER